MKIRVRGFFELIEWGFEAVADRFGVQRRHILFGLFVLLLSTFFTAWYIYHKNWVISGKNKGSQPEEYMTVSLDGEESAMQELVNEIRQSILDTPMAAAATSESMAQSSASPNAQRSEPQNIAANQSASALSAAASAPSAVDSASSFAPTATQAKARVMAGQARSENSQSLTAATPLPSSQSAAGNQSVRSSPQSTAAKSAAAKDAASLQAASIAGREEAILSLASSLASAKMSTSGAKSVSSQRISVAITQPKIQEVSGASAARSMPQTTAAQSSVAAASTANEASMSSAANPNSSISPSSTSQAFQASVKAEGARAETSQAIISQAVTQTVAKQASDSSSAHSKPQSATAAQSVSASSAQSLATTQAMGAPASQSGNIVPSLSGSRAASSGVQSSSAQAARGQIMASAASQALVQAMSGSVVDSARENPASATSGQRSASATRSISIISGSIGAKASFAPSVSGSRAAMSEMQNTGAKSVSDRSLSGANAQSLAQSATGSRGPARSNPSLAKGNGESSSVQSSISVLTVAGSKGTGNHSLSPMVSGSRAAAIGVRSTGAQAEKRQNLSGASTRSMATTASGSLGSVRGTPGASVINTNGSAQGFNSAVSITGARGNGSSTFVPTISNGSMTTASGMASRRAKSVASRNMAGISVATSSRPSNGMAGSARSGPAPVRGNFNGSAGPVTVRSSISGAEAVRLTYRPISVKTSPSKRDLASVRSTPITLANRRSSGSQSRLGSSKPNSSTQVMFQAGTRALVGPVSMGGPRSRPKLDAIKKGTKNTFKSSAQPVRVALLGRSGSSERLESRDRKEIQGIIPAVKEAPRRQQPMLTAKLAPRHQTPKVQIPVTRSKPTYVKSGDPKANHEKKEIRMSQLEQFKSKGFNTRAESRGGRFVFIIDKSRSMVNDDRLDGAKQALKRTLDKLEPDKVYFIYFFSDKTFKMEPDRMLKATSENKIETMKWVQSISADGFTDPRYALSDAIERLKPSTIWLLSDGKFNSTRVNLDKNKKRLAPVLNVIRKINGAQIRINTIGFAASEGEVDDSLEEIALENGGTYRFIPTGDK